MTMEAVRGPVCIVLEFPRRSRLLLEAHEYGRLSVWERMTGCALVLICRDELVRTYAGEHGLRVADSVEAAQQLSDRRNVSVTEERLSASRIANLVAAREAAEAVRVVPRRSVLTLPLFVTGILMALFIGMTIIPHATIQINPVPDTRSLEFYLHTSDSIREANLNGGIPSTQIQFHVAASADVPASGTLELPATYAIGSVTVENRCDSARDLPALTKIGTVYGDDKTMHLVNGGTIAPGSSLRLNVQADVIGEDGNYITESVTELEAPYNRCLRVTADGDLSGGTAPTKTAPTEEDLAIASTRVNEALLTEALAKATAMADDSRIVLENSLRFEQLISETIDPPIGYHGTTLTVTREALFSVRVIATTDIRKQAKTVFAQAGSDVSIQSGLYAGFSPGKQPITFSIRTLPMEEGSDQVFFRVNAEQQGYLTVDSDRIAALVAGLSLAEAREAIQTAISASADPTVQVWPSWYGRMPIAAVNIRTEVRGIRGLTTVAGK